MIDTKELRRLAQAAKNSCESVEWSHEFRSGRYSQGVIISGEENILIVCGANYGCWRDADDDGDSQFKALGDFVAAANPAAVSELLDRLEAAESEALEEARLNGMGSEREAALLAKLEAAKKDRANFLVEMGRLCAQCDALRAKVEAAEKSDAESLAMYRRARDERDALRAKIETAEKERDELRTELNEIRYGVAVAHDTIKALRAKITEMERQEPVGTTGGMPGTTGFTMACFHADKVPIGSKLYALPGAKGEDK